MASPVKTRETYSSVSKKPLVNRILALNAYLKTLSPQQKSDPEILNEVNGIVNDLTAIVGLPVKNDNSPIVFSIENPDEFFEALAQMAESVLPDQEIVHGEIPTNLSELIEQMETQIEAEKAAKALVSKTGISISEARKTVNQFIREQISSIETAVSESTEISSVEKRDFNPIVKKAVPVLIHQSISGETSKPATTPSAILSQVEEANKKGKNATPPVLIALREKQGLLTNVFGKFASISTRAKVEVVRAESTIIVDRLLSNQPDEVKAKVVNQTTASLVNTARVNPPTTSQEATVVFSETVAASVKKVDPSVVVSKKAVALIIKEIPEALFKTLNEIASQPPEITREIAREELISSYAQISGDEKVGKTLAQADIILMDVFGNSSPVKPTILISRDALEPAIIKHFPEIPTQAWISLAEIEQNVPADLFNTWFEGISKSERRREIIAIQASPDQEIIPLANYNPEKFNSLSILESDPEASELFSSQDLPQTGDVQNRINFIRNLFKVWREQEQVGSVPTTSYQTVETISQPTPSWFSNSPIGQGLRKIGGFIKDKIFNKVGKGILKKIGSTAVGQAAKGLLTKLGAAALGAISGIASFGLTLIPVALGFLKKLAEKLGIKLPSVIDFAKKILGVNRKGITGAAEAGGKILAGITLGSVAIPLGAIIIGVFSVLAFLSLLIPIISGSALVQSELGGPGRGTESGIQGDIVDPEGNHLADQTELAMKECGIGDVTEENCTNENKKIWRNCLIEKGIPETKVNKIIYEFCYSAENFETLQCVGFKKAVEPKFPGGNNACWFATSANTQAQFIPKQAGSIQIGDNAVWDSGCCNRCNLSNLDCCGHIGVISKIEQGEGITYIYVTSAQGGTGTVNTIRINIDNPTVIIRY